MLVTPVKKNFNRHKFGESFELPDKSAAVLIKAGLLRAAVDAEQANSVVAPRPRRQYKRRDLQAES